VLRRFAIETGGLHNQIEVELVGSRLLSPGQGRGILKFVMLYGPSGVGKESVARALGKRKSWHVFPQHLAFDVACAVVGFGNNGFEKYQRGVFLHALRTFFENKVEAVVCTFCYVNPASHYFFEGLFALLKEFDISAKFIRLSCDYDEHVSRVLGESRKNSNKIQSKSILDEYLQRFDFSHDIPGVETFKLDNTGMSICESAVQIENYLARQ